MSDFTETIRTAYEQYLLGNKSEAFGLLIPGTKHHYYLSIIDALKRERHALSKETRDLISNFKTHFNDEDVTKVRLQELFLRYDGAKDDQERESIVQEIDTNFIYGYYSHNKPADLKRSKASKDKSSNKDTQEFDQAKYFNEEDVLKQLYTDNSQIYSLHKTLYNKMDFKKISESGFMNFLGAADNFSNLSNESFWEKLVDTLDQKFKTDKYFKPDQYLYNKLTLEQLEGLSEKLPKLKEDSHYHGKIFEKKFHFELDQENKDSFTLQERREQLLAMYKASESRPQSFKSRPQSFKSALLLEILENGVKMDIFDKGYFTEYLKHPLKTWHMNKKQNHYEVHDYVWNQYIGSVQNRDGGRMDSNLDKKLYKKYLECFFNDKGDLDEFRDYFDQDFLDDILEEFEFLSGKEVKKDKIDAKKYERLTNQVLIDILECNKDVFKKDDRVKLVCGIKNVATLHVKIFEFNSENYYRKNLAPFRTDVNLDGMVTAHEEKHEFKELAQKKFRQVFEFPQLDGRVGLFVIEFISNGFSSRAVIKKGSLSLISKITSAGHIAYILDENKEICKDEKAGMWYQNQYFKVDPEKGGRILIPFEKNESTDKTILINDGFAQLTEFKRCSENYTFNVSYIVNHESLLMGKEAEILLKPVLKVCSQNLDLGIMKNTKVTLTTMSFVDNLPVTKTFENLEVSSKQDISVRFQVPPNLQSVNILIETEVKNISKGKTEKLQNSKYINMNTNIYGLAFYESYLRKMKGNYYYYLLGKNGEPLNDVSVTFTLAHSIYVLKTQSVALNTDDDGKVKLGPLKDISSVSAAFNGPHGQCYGHYPIHNETEKVCLPSSLNILEDEEVQLPFITDKEFSQDTVSLVRYTSAYQVIENCFDKVRFHHEKGYQYGKVSISGLQRGHYTLQFLATGVSVSIRVHKGVYWETDSFILKDHSLIEKRDITNIIRVKDIAFEEDKENTKLSFKLDAFGKNTKAHVFAFTFLHTEANANFNSIESNIKDWNV